jgi:hypothetical protein
MLDRYGTRTITCLRSPRTGRWLVVQLPRAPHPPGQRLAGQDGLLALLAAEPLRVVPVDVVSAGCVVVLQRLEVAGGVEGVLVDEPAGRLGVAELPHLRERLRLRGDPHDARRGRRLRHDVRGRGTDSGHDVPQPVAADLLLGRREGGWADGAGAGSGVAKISVGCCMNRRRCRRWRALSMIARRLRLLALSYTIAPVSRPVTGRRTCRTRRPPARRRSTSRPPASRRRRRRTRTPRRGARPPRPRSRRPASGRTGT